VVFLAAFVAFGTLYSAGSNGFDRVSGAKHASADRALERANTALVLDNASYAGGTVSMNVTNTGTTTLSLNETTVLVDNEVRSGTRRVNGDAATDLWEPGETLRVTVSAGSRPSRIDVVAGDGVAVGGAV